MATELERSYLAGVLDADGSIALKQQRNGVLDLDIMVYNVNEPLMHWLEATFGGHARSEKRKKYEHWRIRWVWSASGEAACAVLATIRDYMIVKRPQADLAMEAWATREPTPRNVRRWSMPNIDAIIARRRDYVERMHNLNTIGGNGFKDVFEKGLK